MIRIELLSFSFKTFIKEKKESINQDTILDLYSENIVRDEFEDFTSAKLKAFSERLIESGSYYELVSVTTQVVSLPTDIIYIFSLELEDEDLYED